MKRNIIGILAIVFIFLSIVGILMNRHFNNVRSSEAQQNAYFSNTEYYIKGRMLSKEFLYDYGSEYKRVFLIKMRVDSISFRKTSSENKDSLFSCVYSPNDSILYFVSDYYALKNGKDDNPKDSLPQIIISSKKRTVEFSTGLEKGLRIYGYQYPQLIAEETPETILL